MSFRMVLRSVMSLVARLVGGLCLVAAAYLLAALVGTLWTSPPRPDDGARSRTVFVLSNGYHTDIALPVDDAGRIAGLPVHSADFPFGLEAADYVLVGWGSEAAYTSLKAITDLTVGTIVTALSFDHSVVHLLPVRAPPAGEGVYRIDLSEGQYRDLVDFIAGTFVLDGNGGADIIADVTQGYGDIFYRARYRFSPFYGCNVWAGEALRRAGVRMGRWTPFAQSVEFSLTN